VSEQGLREWFWKTESFLTKKGHIGLLAQPGRVINVDETAVQVNPNRGYVSYTYARNYAKTNPRGLISRIL